MPSVRVTPGPQGALTYELDHPPSALPAILARDIMLAWDLAREAAQQSVWAELRAFRFCDAAGTVTWIALDDRDAMCWAGAVDRAIGLHSARGVSICLRLLALIDLLRCQSWAAGLVAWRNSGACLHPALLRLAAEAPLTNEGRFDASVLRAALPAGGAAGGNLA